MSNSNRDTMRMAIHPTERPTTRPVVVKHSFSPVEKAAIAWAMRTRQRQASRDTIVAYIDDTVQKRLADDVADFLCAAESPDETGAKFNPEQYAGKSNDD